MCEPVRSPTSLHAPPLPVDEGNLGAAVTYRIQLICSSRAEAHYLRALIPDELTFSSQLLPDVTVPLVVDELVLEKSWDVDFRHNRADLGIISMNTGSTTGFMAQSGVMRDNVAAVLFLSDTGTPPPNWNMRHRRDRIVSRPVSEHVLRAAIEETVVEANRILPDQIAEHHLLAFITSLIERGNRLVQPVLSPNRAAGFPTHSLKPASVAWLIQSPSANT